MSGANKRNQGVMRAERRAKGRSRPIAFYLFALILVILIPALIVSLVLLNRNNKAQEDVVNALTNATVQAVGQTIDRELAGMVTTLRVLSSTQSLRLSDLQQFHDRAVIALAGTGAYLIVLDDQYNQMLNTRVAFGRQSGKTSDPASVDLARERRLPVVSNLFFGQTAQAWVFNVVLALPDESSLPALILTQNASNLSAALQSRQLPDGWNAALVDGDNTVITATPGANLLSGDLLAMRQGEADGAANTWRRENFNGDTVVTAEWQSGMAGWRVIAWASSSVVERPLGESLLWLAAWGVAIAALAALMAAVFAQRIGHSVRGLRRDAQRLGRGEPVTAKAYPVAEIAEVSRTLAEASEQRQKADRDVRFLMRELAHRSKNQMTVIAAMAKQTARGAEDVPSYVQAFERRIMGLARSTDLLLTHGRAGVLLSELVSHHLEPFSPADPARVTITGPDVRLNAQAAQILGMAVHELSTNAVKYGAFAGDIGQLNIDWQPNGLNLDLTWRETVQQMPTASDRKGFGTTVLKSMVGGALGADVERICHDDGIEWRFAIPLAAIDPDLTKMSPDEPEIE